MQRRGTIWLLSVGVCLLVAVATTRIGSNKSTKYVHVVTGNQRRQQLLSTESEVDRALGESDGYKERRKKIGRVQATGSRTDRQAVRGGDTHTHTHPHTHTRTHGPVWFLEEDENYNAAE